MPAERWSKLALAGLAGCGGPAQVASPPAELPAPSASSAAPVAAPRAAFSWGTPQIISPLPTSIDLARDVAFSGTRESVFAMATLRDANGSCAVGAAHEPCRFLRVGARRSPGSALQGDAGAAVDVTAWGTLVPVAADATLSTGRASALTTRVEEAGLVVATVDAKGASTTLETVPLTKRTSRHSDDPVTVPFEHVVVVETRGARLLVGTEPTALPAHVLATAPPSLTWEVPVLQVRRGAESHGLRLVAGAETEFHVTNAAIARQWARAGHRFALGRWVAAPSLDAASEPESTWLLAYTEAVAPAKRTGAADAAPRARGGKHSCGRSSRQLADPDVVKRTHLARVSERGAIERDVVLPISYDPARPLTMTPEPGGGAIVSGTRVSRALRVEGQVAATTPAARPFVSPPRERIAGAWAGGGAALLATTHGGGGSWTARTLTAAGDVSSPPTAVQGGGGLSVAAFGGGRWVGLTDDGALVVLFGPDAGKRHALPDGGAWFPGLLVIDGAAWLARRAGGAHEIYRVDVRTGAAARAADVRALDDDQPAAFAGLFMVGDVRWLAIAGKRGVHFGVFGDTGWSERFVAPAARIVNVHDGVVLAAGATLAWLTRGHESPSEPLPAKPPRTEWSAPREGPLTGGALHADTPTELAPVAAPAAGGECPVSVAVAPRQGLLLCEEAGAELAVRVVARPYRY